MLTPENVLQSKEFDLAASEIAKVGRFLAEQGWSPATSSNYSVRLTDKLQAITRTGVDKFEISPRDIIVIDETGAVVAPLHQRASAETLIHTAIYKKRAGAHAILHTHSSRGTRLSLKYALESAISFSGYEMQKGLSQNKSHESTETLPVLANSQDMTAFAMDVESLLAREKAIHGFLIAGHGLYTWGSSLAEAKRHVETFEFLFECKTFELAGV